jgi:hypothetical protein
VKIWTCSMLVVLLVGMGARSAMADPVGAHGRSVRTAIQHQMKAQGYTDNEIEARLRILSPAEQAQLAQRPASINARGGENVALNADGSPIALLFLGLALAGIGLACMA